MNPSQPNSTSPYVRRTASRYKSLLMVSQVIIMTSNTKIEQVRNGRQSAAVGCRCSLCHERIYPLVSNDKYTPQNNPTTEFTRTLLSSGTTAKFKSDTAGHNFQLATTRPTTSYMNSQYPFPQPTPCQLTFLTAIQAPPASFPAMTAKNAIKAALFTIAPSV